MGHAQNDAVTGESQPSDKIGSADSRLPDGTVYVSWEQPLTFSKTYYVDNQSARADDNGPGTAKRPFRTINKAAQVLSLANAWSLPPAPTANACARCAAARGQHK